MSTKRTVTRRVNVAERAQIVAEIPLRGDEGRGGSIPLLLLGEGGVASHELGVIVGVSAEAPLPRVIVTEKKLTLDGICGIASSLQHWGATPSVACPQGSGFASSLQRSLLKQEGIGHWPLRAGTPQITRFTQRLFAGGHQLTHLETDESVLPSRPGEINRSWSKILKSIGNNKLLGIIDNGNTGLGSLNLPALLKCAQSSKVPIFYEPRTARLLPLKGLDVVKVNDNQMRHWFGVLCESEAGALAAVKIMIARTGSKNVIYTRGERGILLCHSARNEYVVHFIQPEPKKIFDLVSVGDVVSAALLLCLAQGRPLLEAVCFAATAAEYGLDRRYSKRIELQSIC